MKEGQTDIFYMTGESRPMLENSPHIEAFREKGYVVLLLTDPVDEMWVDVVHGFGGKRLQSIAKGKVDLDTEQQTTEDATEPEQHQTFAALLAWLQVCLKDNLKEVRLSSRLTKSPVCIVGDEYDLTPSLEKLYRASGQDVPHVKRILELNPKHTPVEGLRDAYGERGNSNPALGEVAELLYRIALLAEGGDLSDPWRFIQLMALRLTRAL